MPRSSDYGSRLQVPPCQGCRHQDIALYDGPDCACSSASKAWARPPKQCSCAAARAAPGTATAWPAASATPPRLHVHAQPALQALDVPSLWVPATPQAPAAPAAAPQLERNCAVALALWIGRVAAATQVSHLHLARSVPAIAGAASLVVAPGAEHWFMVSMLVLPHQHLCMSSQSERPSLVDTTRCPDRVNTGLTRGAGVVSEQGQCCAGTSATLDRSGACCDGAVDACGVCNGSGQSTDFTGACCAGALVSPPGIRSTAETCTACIASCMSKEAPIFIA